MTEPAILGTFASHAFLRGLDERHLMTLAAGATPFTAEAGEYLAREGEPAHAFYLIQSGHVALGTAKPSGQFVSLQVAGPGEVVGWSWLLPPHRWHLDCRAMDTVQGIKFDANWLRDQCEQDHDFGYRLLKHLLAVLASRLAAWRLAGSGQGKGPASSGHRLDAPIQETP